jgi:His-Xaa-Ser system radical SAM maturase HxsC
VITLTTHGTTLRVSHDVIGRVALKPVAASDRADTVLVVNGTVLEDGNDYAAVVTAADSIATPTGVPTLLKCSTEHLQERDIVLINPRGFMRTVIRAGSASNSLFATDRCNSLCLMCSQPPKEVDDTGKAAELSRIVRLMDPATASLGITGGEPTLLGDGLLEVIRVCRDHLPNTALHVLSNGRRFWYPAYARALADIRHPNLMIGIPLYADIESIHDYVVQAKGAFDETVVGLQNLGNYGVPVEIRVVIQRHTAPRLKHLAEFIYRNLTFAAHVAFMGLEITGYAKGNLADLWIDPEDYAAQLEPAVRYLSVAGLTVSVYNHQLCRVPRSLWPFCRQSISDWKNEYAAECNGCFVREQCGGFFAWNLGHDRAKVVYPITEHRLSLGTV